MVRTCIYENMYLGEEYFLSFDGMDEFAIGSVRISVIRKL